MANDEYKPLNSPSGSYAGQEEDALVDRILQNFPERASQRTRSLQIIRYTVEFILILLLGLNVYSMFGGKVSSSDTGTDRRVSSGPLNQHPIFGHDENYMSIDHKWDYLWETELAEDHGNIAFPPFNASGYSLDQKHDEGSIGMFHSLHCLAGIRKALQRASAGENIGKDAHDDPHWPHCLYYLRQSILCAADDTFELAYDIYGNLEGDIAEGVYDRRTCRDPQPLYDLVRKYGIEKREKAAGKSGHDHGRMRRGMNGDRLER
ncbi:hypothetical protein HII31_11064 [Pseudocercospora fuligena]|uniref:Oxidase ustYa n=1 Tax=Pseudocercospora fuligena TaxID=685502 RepID=A0A8H6R9D1_9PEZI|nr:hypothetical protein HII31_11064 [Pseudocercospora fuligena]